jgi:hypothetical protein
LFVFLSAALIAVFSPRLGVADEPAQVVIAKNVMVPMRDGVRLATDIYFPAAEARALPGPFPVVLIRTPYDKNGKDADGMFFAKHGYVFVAQDVRGRYESEGDFYIYVNEGPDGYDCVEWTREQPWCNGKVGTYGSSYQAATQNALAVYAPSSLRAMFVVNGTSNYAEDGAGRGGAFALLHNMTYCFRLASTGKEAAQDELVRTSLESAYANLAQWLTTAPLTSASPLRGTPSYQQWYSDWRTHATYDEYWKQVGYSFEEHYARYPAVPICIVGGWYDIFKRGTLRHFEGLATRSATTKLIMGPWTHSSGITYAGDVDFGPAAELSLRDEALRWYDQFLKDEPKGILDEPPVKYFVMGAEGARKDRAGRLQSGGRWESASTWPPEGLVERKLYLNGDGALRPELPSETAMSRFEFDPSDPVPTVGGNIDSGKHLVPRGAQQQVPRPDHPFASDVLPLNARHDVLSFETPALTKPMEVTGPVQVSLWVSSEAKDTDFTGKLIDVYPPSHDYPEGFAMNLEDGIVRMRFRHARSKEELMEPGAVYPVTIDLWAISNRFEKGHRIRLDLSSSNFPMYDVNPNTGEPIGKHTHLKKTINTVHHGGDYPSCLVLPVRGED